MVVHSKFSKIGSGLFVFSEFQSSLHKLTKLEKRLEFFISLLCLENLSKYRPKAWMAWNRNWKHIIAVVPKLGATLFSQEGMSETPMILWYLYQLVEHEKRRKEKLLLLLLLSSFLLSRIRDVSIAKGHSPSPIRSAFQSCLIGKMPCWSLFILLSYRKMK